MSLPLQEFARLPTVILAFGNIFRIVALSDCCKPVIVNVSTDRYCAPGFRQLHLLHGPYTSISKDCIYIANGRGLIPGTIVIKIR